MLIGVRTSELRFHYTLGMDRTAVWAIALDLRFRAACGADSSRILLRSPASKTAIWRASLGLYDLGGIMLRRAKPVVP
jgi:hypothetical protein